MKKSPSPHARIWTRPRKFFLSLSLLTPVFFLAVSLAPAHAASVTVDLGPTGGEGGMGALQLLFLFVLIALLPSLLIMMTSFTRIVIVFSFLRSALGLQQTPPNQVLIGLSLVLSLFIMSPTLDKANDAALQPYLAGEIGVEEAVGAAQRPFKEFMLRQTKTADLNLFLSISGAQPQAEEGEGGNLADPDALMELGMEVVMPAFLTTELKRAFTIGFLLYLPFLAIDMIVSSTLMSMGMVMLPPSMISMPFKLLLFVVVNGWSRIMETLVAGFR